MGFLVDRYQLPNSKHKHWIAISIPVMMLATYLLFFPIKESVNSAYLFISLFIIYAGFTLPLYKGCAANGGPNQITNPVHTCEFKH